MTAAFLPNWNEEKPKTDSRANNLIQTAAKTFGDPSDRQLTAEDVQAIKQKHIEGAIARMKALNADVGNLQQPLCKYCLNKGYTVGVRNGIELVSFPCSCQSLKTE